MPVQLPSTLAARYFPGEKRAVFDYVNAAQTEALGVADRIFAVKHLLSLMLRLAATTADQPTIERVTLVLLKPRPSWTSLRNAWRHASKAIITDVRQKLSLIVVTGPDVYSEPETSSLFELGNQFRAMVAEQVARPADRAITTARPTDAYANITKLLLLRWLRHEGPVSIGLLAKLVGCSYPTAARAVDRLATSSNALRRDSKKVSLSRFPEHAWRELTSLAGVLRPARRYADSSGRPMPPESLIRRLNRFPPAKIAYGGIVAARHWYPGLDLNGVPRIDLVEHCIRNEFDSQWSVRTLDPALVLQEPGAETGTSLVIHQLTRHNALFENSGDGVPIADPVEAALDLYEMHLIPQANDLLAHFRPEVRLS